jgi:hypothetical protein
MLPIKNRYDEIFEVEIDGWCYGLSHFQGEIHPAVVFRVVGELSVSFKAAVENNVIFDVIDVATRLSKAAKYLVHEKEITFSILAHLPSPSSLDDDGKFILGQLVDQIEQAYGGALERLQKKWIWEKRKAEEKARFREKRKAA